MKMQNEILFTDKEVADFLRISVHTLRSWRVKKRGPPYIKIEHGVRYPQSSLTEWIAEQSLKALKG